MADEFSWFHDKETGQEFINPRGSDRMIPVTDAQARVLGEGGLEAFVKSAVNSAGQLITGAGALVDQAITGGTEARSQYDALRSAQEMRDTANPVAGFAGSIAPDVALGALTGGTGSLAARVGGTAAVEGAIGAARNPDDPLAGAAVQGAFGAAAPLGIAGAARLGGGMGAVSGAGRRMGNLVNEVRLGPARMADRVTARMDEAIAAGAARDASRVADDMSTAQAMRGPRSVGAAQVAGEPYERTNRALEGFLTSRDAQDIGLPLTKGDIAALDAPAGEAYQAANAMRAEEEILRSSEFGTIGHGKELAAGEEGVQATRERQIGFLTNRLAAELGAPDVANLTREVRARVRGEVGQVFEDIMTNNPDPIPGRRAVVEMRGLADNATGNAKEQAMKHVEEINRKLTANGYIRKDTFTSIRNALANDAESAYGSGNYELQRTLSRMQEVLDDALEDTLTPEVREQLWDARRRWRMLKALEYRSATDAGGELNPRAFQRAYEAVTPSFKRASRESDEFEQLIDTLAYLTQKVQPDSGTAARIRTMVLQRKIPGIQLLG